MDVHWESMARGIGLAIPPLVAIAGYFRGPKGRRARIDNNLDLMLRLPEESNARAVMSEWIDNQVASLRNFESEAKRDLQGMVISALLTVAFGALAWWLISLGHWWWYLLSVVPGVFVPVGLASTFNDAQLAKRDGKGVRIPD